MNTKFGKTGVKNWTVVLNDVRFCSGVTHLSIEVLHLVLLTSSVLIGGCTSIWALGYGFKKKKKVLKEFPLISLLTVVSFLECVICGTLQLTLSILVLLHGTKFTGIGSNSSRSFASDTLNVAFNVLFNFGEASMYLGLAFAAIQRLKKIQLGLQPLSRQMHRIPTTFTLVGSVLWAVLPFTGIDHILMSKLTLSLAISSCLVMVVNYLSAVWFVKTQTARVVPISTRIVFKNNSSTPGKTPNTTVSTNKDRPVTGSTLDGGSVCDFERPPSYDERNSSLKNDLGSDCLPSPTSVGSPARESRRHVCSISSIHTDLFEYDDGLNLYTVSHTNGAHKDNSHVSGLNVDVHSFYRSSSHEGSCKDLVITRKHSTKNVNVEFEVLPPGQPDDIAHLSCENPSGISSDGNNFSAPVIAGKHQEVNGPETLYQRCSPSEKCHLPLAKRRRLVQQPLRLLAFKNSSRPNSEHSSQTTPSNHSDSSPPSQVISPQSSSPSETSSSPITSVISTPSSVVTVNSSPLSSVTESPTLSIIFCPMPPITKGMHSPDNDSTPRPLRNNLFQPPQFVVDQLENLNNSSPENLELNEEEVFECPVNIRTKQLQQGIHHMPLAHAEPLFLESSSIASQYAIHRGSPFSYPICPPIGDTTPHSLSNNSAGLPDSPDNVDELSKTRIVFPEMANQQQEQEMLEQVDTREKGSKKNSGCRDSVKSSTYNNNNISTKCGIGSGPWTDKSFRNTPQSSECNNRQSIVHIEVDRLQSRAQTRQNVSHRTTLEGRIDVLAVFIRSCLLILHVTSTLLPLCIIRVLYSMIDHSTYCNTSKLLEVVTFYCYVLYPLPYVYFNKGIQRIIERPHE